MHATTVAKIERATRPTALNEYFVIAEVLSVLMITLLDDWNEPDAMARARLEYLTAREAEEYWKRELGIARCEQDAAQSRVTDANRELLTCRTATRKAKRSLEQQLSGTRTQTSASALAAPRKRGAYKLVSDHLAEVARVYREAQGKPTQTVATAFDVPLPTASSWVVAARREGFLEPYSAKH